MPADLIPLYCIVFVPLFLMLLLVVHAFGKSCGWQQAGRRASTNIALKEGETLYGVVQKGKTHHFVIRRETSHDKGYE
jgi:hypothetical protein